MSEQFKVSLGLFGVGALFGCAVIGVVDGCSKGTREALPAASVDPGMVQRNTAIVQCERAGDVPAMGYGFSVVCIKRESVTEYTQPKWRER